MTDQKKTCFVAMPNGNTLEDQKWFRGWYREVIVKGIESAGYEAVLATDIL